jgi:hypothetical protein
VTTLVEKIREHSWTTALVGVLSIVGAAATSGAISWADARYVLAGAYSTDQVSKGVLTIDMQIRQVDYRLRDAAQDLAAGRLLGDTRMQIEAEADQVFYAVEKDALLRRRTDLIQSR